MQFLLSRNHLTALTITLAGSFYVNNNAFASDDQWYLRLHTGLSQLSDTNGSTASVGSLDGNANINLDNGFIAGMAIGYRYGSNWAAELAWDYRTNDSETTLADGALFNDGNYASNIFFLNGLYHFSTSNNWEPYVGAGLAWIQEIDLDLEDQNTEISYSGDGNIGAQVFAGVNYLINEDWSINSELRYSDLGDVDLDGEAGAVGSVKSLEYAPLTFQFGASYRF